MDRRLLHYAVAEDAPEIIEALLEGGANPHVHDAYGDTPLHDAIGYESFGSAEILIRAMDDLEIANHNGYTRSTDWPKTATSD